jgi:prepilin-type N-terminal cleavage/methylation domain-containing protein
MKHARPGRLAGSRGFTLVESIMVLVVLGIGAAAIVSLQANVFKGQSGNADLEVGVQLMQECAEQVLATRRGSGYTAVNQNTCSTLGNVGNFAPGITLTADGVSGAASCAGNTTTCTVEVTASKGGASLKKITLQLVNY